MSVDEAAMRRRSGTIRDWHAFGFAVVSLAAPENGTLTSAPPRARKVARPSRPPGQDGMTGSQLGYDRRVYLTLHYLIPPLLAGGIAAGVLLWHILFGAGAVGLLVFFFSTLTALGFVVVAVYDWLRFRKRN